MIPLANKEWQAFRVLDFFDVNKFAGAENNMDALPSGNTPLISAKSTGNGLKGFVSVDRKKIKPSGVITWNKDGDGGAGLAYYQPSEFAVDSHIFVLYPKQELPDGACVFVSKILSQYYGFFGHGRANSLSRIKKTQIQLPVDSAGEPDWYYMEQYTKKAMRQQMTAYLNYIGCGAGMN